MTTARDNQSSLNLAPGLLIAVPSMQDPFFTKSVVLLVEHDDQGAFGVVLNRKAPVDQETLLDGAGLTQRVKRASRPVWWGGPVRPESGMVLFRDEPELNNYEPSHQVLPGLNCSWSMDLLKDIAMGKGPDTYALFLGCAAWDAGQLEDELEQGAWLPADPDSTLLFTDHTSECWNLALKNIGAHPGTVVPGTPAKA